MIRIPKAPWDWEPENATLSSPTESGYVIKRKKFTRVRDVYTMKWDLLVDEALEIMTFYKTTTQGGALPFTIEIPFGYAPFIVTAQFDQPPKINYVGIDVCEMTCVFRTVF